MNVGSGAEPIGRDEARELARRELEKPVYNRDEPSFVERILDKLREWYEALTPNVSGSGDGGMGWLSVLIIVAVLAVVIALIVWWATKLQRSSKSDRSVLGEERRAAKDHRATAQAHAAKSEWDKAIRETLRAIARDLEERAILDSRPGRTADELAAEAGKALPDCATELARGASLFDDVWYGDRPGTREGYEQLVRLDELVRATRPVPMETAPEAVP